VFGIRSDKKMKRSVTKLMQTGMWVKYREEINY
jgi:hypothetical protein